jgi:hypothetical protein
MHCLIRILPFAAALAASGAQAMGAFPTCGDELTARSRLWAECTREFSRQDDRCNLPTAQMHQQMQICVKKGYSRAQIDAAMDRGFRTAGSRSAPPAALPEPEPQPLPKAKRGPIPGVEAGD